MPVNDSEYRRAVNLARIGDMQAARHILQRLVETHEDDEQVWIWLAATYPDEQHRLQILQLAVQRFPEGRFASKALDTVKRRLAQVQARLAENRHDATEAGAPAETRAAAEVVDSASKEEAHNTAVAPESPAPDAQEPETGPRQPVLTPEPAPVSDRSSDLGRLLLAVLVILLTIVTAYLWVRLR